MRDIFGTLDWVNGEKINGKRLIGFGIYCRNIITKYEELQIIISQLEAVSNEVGLKITIRKTNTEEVRNMQGSGITIVQVNECI